MRGLRIASRFIRSVALGRPAINSVTRSVIERPRYIHTSRVNMSYTIVERGCPYTKDYRVYFKDPNGNVVSPFHDIPLHPAGNPDPSVCNMVVEIPRWSNAKMEISKEEKMNPIKQDIKKEKPRFVKNVFPHHGYIWNYGAIPQTYEDPCHTHPDTECAGDSDPLDVCEIGFKVHPRGSVVQVKILGTVALIDEGETDWKILAIDVDDPLAEKLNDVADIEKEMPGFIKATVEWFRIYKIPDGKPENKFAFNGEAKNKDYAMTVVKECNSQWTALLANEVDSGCISCENTCVMGSPYNVPNDDAQACIDEQNAFGDSETLDPELDKWYYV